MSESFGHFLQSQKWEKYEKSEGNETCWLDGEGYHALAVVKNTPLGKYLFVPYGPAVKELRYMETALLALKSLAQDKEAMFVRIEPTWVLVDKKSGSSEVEDGLTVDFLRKMKCKKSHDIDPAHTWVVDLGLSEEELLAQNERDRVRHWRNHEKRGVTIRKTKEPEEIKVLAELLARLGEARKFTPQDLMHLQRQLEAGFGTLYIAEYEGKAIAATLVDDYDGVRFVMHAAADDEYRKVRAGTTLALEAMMDFKREGGKWFDFWGITTSQNPQHPWYGFTQYKKSFGGKQVDYAGTWDMVVRPVRYQAYRAVRAVNRTLRKV